MSSLVLGTTHGETRLANFWIFSCNLEDAGCKEESVHGGGSGVNDYSCPFRIIL